MADKTARELIARLRGGPQTPRINRFASQAPNGLGVLLRNDPSRVFFLVVNLGTFDCFIAPISNASTTNGVRIPASGGAATVQWDEDGEVVAYEWTVLGNGGVSALFILESVLEGHSAEAQK